MSDSVGPHGWQPTRLPRPRDSPGKNTGMDCHFLLQCVKVKSESEATQSCPTQRPHGLQPTRSLSMGFSNMTNIPMVLTLVSSECLVYSLEIFFSLIRNKYDLLKISHPTPNFHFLLRLKTHLYLELYFLLLFSHIQLFCDPKDCRLKSSSVQCTWNHLL